MLGLALDLGRVYIAKNETQSFTDTAALAAALALNDANFTAPRDAVAANTRNKWNMGITNFAAPASRPSSPGLYRPARPNPIPIPGRPRRLPPPDTPSFE